MTRIKIAHFLRAVHDYYQGVQHEKKKDNIKLSLSISTEGTVSSIIILKQ